ncbi:hypothetical protein PQX77_020196 [Marasmius sp. AFHP31]|nr:hypothetical protein PQX77_020196 [Marasmius sp. AFHP31]
MSHFKKDCAGHCMDGLAANLDLHQPAKDVPHKLEFDDILTEVLFALGTRANPMVLDDVCCRQKVQHPIDMVLVGARYKVKQLDESEMLPKRCNCKVWMYSWDTSISRCMYMGLVVWDQARKEFEGEQEEADEAVRGTDGLTPWERKGIAAQGNQRVKRERDEETDDVLHEEHSGKKCKSN